MRAAFTGALPRTVLTVLLALVMGGVIMQISGKDALNAYQVLFNSAFGSERAIANTLLAATPLIFTGLATLIAFRAGIFNVGVEGSLYVGAFTAAWVGFTFVDLPGVLLIALAFAAGALVGGLWGLIPGYLKARLRVDEIVTTIMLNYVAIRFTDYLVTGPFFVPGMANAMSAEVAPQAQLPRLIERSQLNLSLIVALVVFVVVAFMLRRTTLGYEVKTIGTNPVFARWIGMPVGRTIMLVMFVSGLIGGLAGAGQALGVNYRFVSGFSRGLGFDGIVIALLGRGSPVGVLFSALFLGALRNGASTMEMFTRIPRDLIDIVVALVIFFTAVEVGFDWLRRKRTTEDAGTEATLPDQEKGRVSGNA
ncbi:MAG: ABC transporter permease [Chloroflexi bacterium]|nr:ABC transporter permease [Chloroflexota bacterium]